MTTVLRMLTDALLGVERVIVQEGERALVVLNGQYKGFYGPGQHIFRTRNRDFVVKRFKISAGSALDPEIMALLREHPELAEDTLVEFRTGPGETAAVFRDGVLFGLVKPESRAVYWVDAGPWTVERFDAAHDLRVPDALAKRLVEPRPADPVKRVEVPYEHVGVLFVDGVQTDTLAPGSHIFWSIGPKVEARLIETRPTSLEISQQELLTKDRVTIRVNLTVLYRVTDPVAAVTGVRDFGEALYREAQLALRRTLGAMTLDRILAEQVEIDPAPVRKVMAPLGVEVGELAIKDVILPGEMRAILNAVVAAEKEAEANVIRRREETNATRSLLNTAKVMAENPVMLRLKELEALQELAGKVERLTVHNGTDGLMNDLVRLRD